MKGLDKLINDLAMVTCPSEHDLYEEPSQRPMSRHDCTDTMVVGDVRCIICWKKALDSDVPKK